MVVGSFRLEGARIRHCRLFEPVKGLRSDTVMLDDAHLWGHFGARVDGFNTFILFFEQVTVYFSGFGGGWTHSLARC